MKKLFTILMALLVLGFTQCKPEPESWENDEDTRTVKVTCEIPMNNGTRSDFTYLLPDGVINWSKGTEYVYVAIHGDKPQIIQLKKEGIENNPSTLIFEGEAAKSLIKTGQEYSIWYFGHFAPYIEKNENTPSDRENPQYYYKVKQDGDKYTSIEGSIAKQSGKLSELGYCHIATTTVKATTVGDEVKLILDAVFNNQIAILLLNLENVDERYGLYGDAIKGTEYTLAYDEEKGRFMLDVTYNPSAKIDVVGAEAGRSYIALFPNNTENTEIRYRDGDNVCQYIMNGTIDANSFYYNGTGEQNIDVLPWSVVSSGDVVHNGHYHHYVDLGLPSGTLWATHNVGADTMYHYGDYFAWGEIETKTEYTTSNSTTYNKDVSLGEGVSNDVGISGNTTYDAATAIWGDEWRMPTHTELQELFDECRKEPLKMPTPDGYVNGYKFTAENGNYIFLPAAGYRDQEEYYVEGVAQPVPDYYQKDQWGHYWSSSVLNWHTESMLLHFEKGWDSEDYIYSASRHYGCSIRPVLVKKKNELESDQNQNGSNQGGGE